MENKIKRSHRKYDLQFKSEAVNQVKSGRSVPSVAKALGISDVLLYQWVRTSSSTSDEVSSKETDDLRKQVKQLETERDILKKALAIFSRAN